MRLISDMPAAAAVANVIAAGIIPAGLEMMDRTSSRMVEPFVNAGYDTDAAAILLCEADGTQHIPRHVPLAADSLGGAPDEGPIGKPDRGD